MASIHVTHSIGDLADDLRSIAVRAPGEMSKVVRANLKDGNRTAKAFARESAGKHGKLYHRAFTTEMHGLLSGEYGPDSAMPQGGMSFEYGSRNQKPHLDLNRSADIQGPLFGHAIAELPDRWFW